MGREQTFAFLEEFMRLSRQADHSPEHLDKLDKLLALVLKGFSKDFKIPLKRFNKAFRTKKDMEKATFESKMRALYGCFEILQELAMKDGVDLGFRRIHLEAPEVEALMQADHVDHDGVVFFPQKMASAEEALKNMSETGPEAQTEEISRFLNNSETADNLEPLYNIFYERLANSETSPEAIHEAVEFMKTSASKGYAPAQSFLGSLFRVGLGVPQNDSESLRWYTVASDQGYPIAQAYLGHFFLTGQADKQNFSEAARLLRLAANQEFAPAQTDLGLMYLTGKGVKQNFSEAARLFRLAANQEYPLASYYLGVIYKNGLGVNPDEVEGAKWFKLAFDQGLYELQDPEQED